VSPCLKGRGLFISMRRLDIYKLIVSISSMGFTLPVGLDLRWSVYQGRLEASTVFRPILESSRLPLSIPQTLHGTEVNGAQVVSWRGCLARSLLDDDVFPRGGMWWTG
jgi:hypothetical protein